MSSPFWAPQPLPRLQWACQLTSFSQQLHSVYFWIIITLTGAHTAGLKTKDGHVPEHYDLPSDATQDWNGVNLKWSIGLRDVAPCIRLAFQIYEENVKIHTGCIEFYFGDVHGKGCGVRDLQYTYNNNGPFQRMFLSWQTDGGIAQGMVLPQAIANIPLFVKTISALHRPLLFPPSKSSSRSEILNSKISSRIT